MNSRHSWIVAVAVSAVALAACSDNSVNNLPKCAAFIDSAAQQGAELVVQGEFIGGQPVINLGSTITLIADNYDNNSATFDLSHVPAGTYSVSVDISCDDPTAKPTKGTAVKSITIQATS
jgi:hypothetical protein